jgi:hypothetical protein
MKWAEVLLMPKPHAMNILQNMETELQALFLNLALAGSR